jgi:hypothetical protein
MRSLALFIFIFSLSLFAQSKGVITGKILNYDDNTPLPACNIIVEETPEGTVTDKDGKFSITLPYGTYTLKITYVGYEIYEQLITISEDEPSQELEIKLKPAVVLSREVTVTGRREAPSTIVQEIEPKDLQRMPKLYNDVMRAVQILPGVISISELSSGYNVRGGNFDDNLIYLNGFEIYRPFLLRQGVEENQTIINPDLTGEFRFYNGSFPAAYGDKMSSALEVNYTLRDDEKLSGTLRADFINTGITLQKKTGNLSTAVAFRYSYPGLFLNELQTNGDYRPAFRDYQVFAKYKLSQNSSVELFGLYARNKFDLTPTDWKGQFGGFTRYDIRGLELYYQGERTYSFNTGLYGVKFISQLNNNTAFKISADIYTTSEDETSDVTSLAYYLPDADDTSYKEYIKSGAEDVNNSLKLTSYELIPEVSYKYNKHLFTAGLNLKLADVDNVVNEHFSEEGDSVAADLPVDRVIGQNFKLNSYSAFIQDEFNVNNNIIVNAGVRTTYYEYNEEFIISPRVNTIWLYDSLHTFTLSWGYYFQPPYYAELRNKADVKKDILKSQRAVHYSAGWEYRFKKKLKLNIEAYYKDLSNLIPYYVDREKTEYYNKNSSEGFAYGFDAMVQGEIVEGLNSWLGYGYLNTQERNTGGGEYRRRLTDNNHSIQVFLQDKIKKHPNWQAHLRLLFNTGYVFSKRQIVTDEQTGKKYIKVYYDEAGDYPAMYMRADMGLSASFDITNYKLVVVAEVMNLFDHRNFGSYRFVQVSNEGQTLFAIPQVLSSRFFNVGVELKF